MSTLAKTISTEAQNLKFDSVFECPRCNGKGWLPEFRHIKNGDCFLCGGAKVISCKTVVNFGQGRKPQVCFTPAANENCLPALSVIFDTKIGYQTLYAVYIKDDNRQEMRDLWKWFKVNGATMLKMTWNDFYGTFDSEPA